MFSDLHFCMCNVYWFTFIYEQCLFIYISVWEMFIDLHLCMSNVYWFTFLYEQCLLIYISVWAMFIDLHFCMCNVYWFTFLYVQCLLIYISVCAMFSDLHFCVCNVYWFTFLYVQCLVIYTQRFKAQWQHVFIAFKRPRPNLDRGQIGLPLVSELSAQNSVLSHSLQVTRTCWPTTIVTLRANPVSRLSGTKRYHIAINCPDWERRQCGNCHCFIKLFYL
jgi:hypothetical protein